MPPSVSGGHPESVAQRRLWLVPAVDGGVACWHDDREEVLMFPFRLFLAAALVGCPAVVPDDTGPDTDTTPVDADSDGYDADVDCDDDDAAVHPGADELCNSIDDNCDGVIDDEPIDRQTVYMDVDGDSFGDPGTEDQVCNSDRLDAHVDNDGDCDDDNDAINPDAQEVCDPDDVDEDCDGDADDLDESTDKAGMRLWYSDLDGDNYGDPNSGGLACDGAVGSISDNTDCDDDNPLINPDLGCPDVWDGEWDGRLAFDIAVPDLGLRDTCSATGTLVIQAGATNELTTLGGRPWTCTGTETEATFDITGSFVDSDTIDGEFDIDGEIFEFTAELSEADGLRATGTETRTIDGTTFSIGHELTAKPR